MNGIVHKSARRGLSIAVAVGILLMDLTAASAWAQRPGRLIGEEGGMLTWAIAAALGVVICGSAFLNPKRSHLT